MLLNRIVGQMHEFVRQIVHGELTTRCAKVPLFVEISLHVAVDGGDECKDSYVKFAPVYQQRIRNVLLDDASAALGPR